MTVFSNQGWILLSVVCFIMVLCLLFILVGGRSYEYEDAGEEEINGRIGLALDSVDVLWNTFGIADLLTMDEATIEQNVQTKVIAISPDVFLVTSAYDVRSIRLTVLYNYKRKKVFIRIEQSISGWEISVEHTFKLKPYLLSRDQAVKVLNRFYNITQKAIAKSKKQKEQDTKEE